MKYYQHGETGRVVATDTLLIGEWCEIRKDQYEATLQSLGRSTPRVTDEFCPRCKSYFPTDAVECSHCGFNVHQTPR